MAAVKTKFINRPNRRAKVAGFTLIALLVVIAIIAILAGCLVSSLALAQPTITRQLSDKFLDPGKSATFLGPGVKGTPPYTFQWLFDGRAIAGATNYTLH